MSTWRESNLRQNVENEADEDADDPENFEDYDEGGENDDEDYNVEGEVHATEGPAPESLAPDGPAGPALGPAFSMVFATNPQPSMRSMY